MCEKGFTLMQSISMIELDSQSYSILTDCSKTKWTDTKVIMLNELYQMLQENLFM